MSEKPKSLTRQVSELSSRLDKLEASLGKSKGVSGKGTYDEEPQHFCALPEVPERQFDATISPFRISMSMPRTA